MIDTIQLFSPGFQIASSNPLVVTPPMFGAENGKKIGDSLLWKSIQGKEYRGQNAFCNVFTENNVSINVKIYPYPPSPKIFITFSVPKIVNGNNFYPVQKSTLYESIQKVEQVLCDSGIKVPLMSCNISRIDTFINVFSDFPFQVYGEVFRFLRVQQQHSRDFGTTWMVYNNQQKLMVYDKRVEMTKKGYDTSVYPANTLRFEQSLKKRKKVHDVMGFSDTAYLVEKGFGELRMVQKEQWKKYLFHMKVPKSIPASENQLQCLFQYFKNNYGRNWVQKTYMVLGVHQLVKEYGMDSITQTLLNLGEEYPKRRKNQNEMKNSEEEMILLKESFIPSIKTYELFNELKLKVCEE